jgi:tetratricopeptide (TPR) repeat protein
MSTVRWQRVRAAFLCLFFVGSGVSAQEAETLASARDLIHQNKNREAITQLRALQARHPEMKGVNRLLGIAHFQAAEYLEAALPLRNAWHENPEDRDTVQLLGLSYYFTGKPAEAIPLLEQVHRWDPKASMDAIYILGLCYILDRNYPKALETFADSYGVPRNSAAAHLLLARMLLRQGFDPIGESELQKALALEPHLPLAHFTLGEFAVYRADYSAAIRQFNDELAINSNYAPALTRLGDVYWRLNRYDEAEGALRRSLWLDSAAAEPYVVMGKVLLKKKQFAMAERLLQQAIRLDSGSYIAHHFLGQLYRETGRTDAFAREMRAAAEIQQRQASVSPRDP